MISKKLEWYGPEVTAKLRAAARKGLEKGAQYLLEETNRIVPHDEGDLERGGVASVANTDLIAMVSYGNNESAAYTIVQHEDLTLNHINGRQPKFLTRTADRYGKTAMGEVEKALKAVK